MYPILVALILLATPDDTGPLTAAVPVIDRGEVPTGPLLASTFELTHTGTGGTITITGIETTCGCLNPTKTKTQLQPGEHTQVTLVVNTLTQPAGPNSWPASIRYRLDQGTERKLTIKVSADLIREVAVEPPQVEFSTGSGATQTLSVIDRRPKPLTVVSVMTTSPHLTVSVQPSRDSNGYRTQQIDLQVGPEFPPGRSDETVILTTSDPTCRELRVPVRVTKRMPSDLATYPESLEIRFSRGQVEASGLVQLRRPSGGEIRIEKVDCVHPGLQSRWTPVSGPVASIRVVVDSRKIEGSGQSEIRVTLANQPTKTVTIPVKWILP